MERIVLNQENYTVKEIYQDFYMFLAEHFTQLGYKYRKSKHDMYKNIENTGVKDIIYYYKNFYEVNSDITRYINGYNIYFSEIDKIDEKYNSSIEEIKKKDRINVFLYNTNLDKIDEILQKLDGKYKIIKENKTFYGKMYLLSK